VIKHVAAVSGAAPGGHLVLGLVHPAPAIKDVCLAELDPANSLRATGTACGLALRVDNDAPVSPDGHWLAATAADGAVALLDLTTVFQRPAVAARWMADRSGVWTDATTMVEIVSGRLHRVDVRGGTAVPLEVPGLPAGALFTLVPRVEPG